MENEFTSLQATRKTRLMLGVLAELDKRSLAKQLEWYVESDFERRELSLNVPTPHAGREYQRQIVTVGTDDRGNKIQYIDNEDGTWTNLYNEVIVNDDFMQRHFSDLLNGEQK